MLDSLFPGSFAFARVKWGAKHEHEFVDNYKLLQAAFDKNGIKRHIDVGKLVKARYLDNLEFCQWLKAYFEKNYSGDEYDALTRRKNQQLYYILGGSKVGVNPQPAPRSGAAASSAGSRQPSGAAASNTGPRVAGSNTGGVPRAGAGAGAAAGGAASTAKVRELEATV